MYERSAIILERYFEKLLGFDKTSNLKQNYKNYCDLFEKFIILQDANSGEIEALEAFQAVERNIEEIQVQQEKIYKKNAKLEYNRDLLFADISQKPAEIEKCIVKIENDIAKNQVSVVTLRENFVEAVKNYNKRKIDLSKCKKNRKEAENEYNVSFEILQNNLNNIEEAYIEVAQGFATPENEEELVSIMTDNGKEEKIPFNNLVLTGATKLGFEIVKIEVEAYLEVYKMSQKLIKELLNGAVGIETHQKLIRNIKVKLNFLNAKKEYLIQFLDYERITVIYGKRTHRTLMLEAYEKFETDIIQINNLYQLILKEIANKSTKKAYKELYNKSYLIDIEEKEAKFKKEKSKVNLPIGTIMNSNYWRIEGIKNIYTVFYKDISEVFGKDLIEFDLPKEVESEIEPENETVQETEIIEKVEIVEKEDKSKKEKKSKTKKETTKEIEEETVELEVKTEELPQEIAIIEEAQTKKVKKPKRYTRKISVEKIEENPKVEIAEIEEQVKESKEIEDEKEIENIVAFEEIKEDKKVKKEKRFKAKKTKKIKEEIALFEHKETLEEYKDIEIQIAELNDLEDIDIVDILEDMPYEKDDIPFEEESIFENIENIEYKEINLKKKDKNKPEKNKSKKKGIFDKLIKINSKAKNKVNT